MKGLLEQAAVPGMAPTAPTTANPPVTPPVATGTEPGSVAGDFNQKDMDLFVVNGVKMIHNTKVSDDIIARVIKSENPVVAVADATLLIVGQLEQSAASAGKKISLTTIAYGSNFLMGEIIASAEAAGMKKMDDKTKYQAFSLAMGKYLDEAIKTGKMTKEELIQMGKDAEGTPIGKKMAEVAVQMEVPATAPGASTGIGVPTGMPATGRL